MHAPQLRGQPLPFILAIAVAAVFLLHGGASADAATALNDTAISDAVEDELLMDYSIRAYLVDVTTMEGVVTLSGIVDNLLARERAARVAEAVKGVRAVVNTIRVQPPILVSDHDIEKDVRQALLADPAAEAYAVDVSVTDQVVTLSGTVNSWQERERS